MTKLTKGYLVKQLRTKGVKLSRDERNDLEALKAKCFENGIELDEPTTNEPTPSTDEPTPSTDEPTTSNDEPNVEDESNAMFARMQATSIDNPQNEATFNVNPDIETVNIKNTKKTRTKNGEKKVVPENETFNIEGYMLLLVIDLILPAGVSFVVNLFEKDKTKHIQPSDISLKDDQKANIMPLADSAARSLTIKLSPVTAFAVVYILSCGANVMLIKSTKQ